MEVITNEDTLEPNQEKTYHTGRRRRFIKDERVDVYAQSASRKAKQRRVTKGAPRKHLDMLGTVGENRGKTRTGSKYDERAGVYQKQRYATGKRKRTLLS